MHISTKGRYAVMALLDLVKQQQSNGISPVSLADIAARQQISLSYLEQLFAKLRQAGVVCSVRGPGGGYVLAQAAEDIWLNTIIAAVDETTDVTRCGHHTLAPDTAVGCIGGAACNAHDLWVALSGHIDQFLGTINLAMIVTGRLTPTTTAMPTTPLQVRIVS